MFNPNTKILIVDDLPIMRKIVASTCYALGFRNFTEVADGELAWKAILEKENGFDLVISDWNMPNCSGLELLTRIRSSEKFERLPFIFVTAESEPSQIKAAIKAGMSGYVIKPFTASRLREQIAAVRAKSIAA